MTCADVSDGDRRSYRPAPRPAADRLSRLHRHLVLWVLQAWLALFYIAVGYTKLIQPNDVLSLLVTWPARTTLDLVHALGWIEIGLAVGLLSPLLSWPRFRFVMSAAAGGLLIDATIMLWSHALDGYGLPAVLDGVLALTTLAVIIGRSRSVAGRLPA